MESKDKTAARPSEEIQVAKATHKKIKEEVAACKAALKAAKTDQEKTAARQSLEAAEARCNEAAEKIAALRQQEEQVRQAAQEAARRAKEQEAAKDPFKALAAHYAKAYPKCRAFHITSDMQVFLDHDLNLAQCHQATLGEGEVRTINI